MSGIELRHLRAFAAAAAEMHFTRAAARLNLAQQALSAQIRQLEAGLGVELFHRSTRRVELTAAGEVFLRRVPALLANLDDAVDEARRAAEGEQSTLTLAYTPTVAGEDLPIILEGVRRRAPELTIVTCETWTPETVSGVFDGRFDAAFARCPTVKGDVESMTIRREPLGIILGATHHLAALSVVPVRELEPYALVIWPRRISPGFFDEIVDAFPDHVASGRICAMENFTHETCFGDIVARTTMADNRAFFATLERHYDPLPEGFAWRPLSPSPLVGLDLVYRTGRRTPAVKVFLDAVLDSAHECGWL